MKGKAFGGLISLLAVSLCQMVSANLVFDTYENHECIRPCSIYSTPKVCEYEFTLELFFTVSLDCYDCPFNKTHCDFPRCISADGRPRGVIVANRMLPGPPIHVCQGDTIVVKVNNHLAGGEGTSIHWHGIFQRETPWMDGIGMVTQCPIHDRTFFEYRFPAENAGTHFYHAHSGFQRGDGLFGALVVRVPDLFEPHINHYDEDLPEHTMSVHDWFGRLTAAEFADTHHNGGPFTADTILINGRGRMAEFINPVDNSTLFTPVAEFHVTQGVRYRFRVISSGILTCPVQVSIDNHIVEMIATDGIGFQKTDADSFVIYPGERYDFVLNANQAPGNYWIRARGLLVCSLAQASQVAILRYAGAPDQDPPGATTYADADRQGTIVNPLNELEGPERIPVSSLVGIPVPGTPVPHPALAPNADKKFYLGMDLERLESHHFNGDPNDPGLAMGQPWQRLQAQVDKINLALPPSPPLTQLDDLPEEIFCDKFSLAQAGRNCTADHCHCVHRIKVDLYDVVELIIVDEGKVVPISHPMHLHGYAFHVVGLDMLGPGTTADTVKALDDNQGLARNLVDPPRKDTVAVPSGGYVIARFYADNPGVWFFHCHYELHLAEGMGLFVQVGESGDFVPPPKNFPTCGNFKMPVRPQICHKLDLLPPQVLDRLCRHQVLPFHLRQCC